jgi:hypothetical protein
MSPQLVGQRSADQDLVKIVLLIVAVFVVVVTALVVLANWNF